MTTIEQLYAIFQQHPIISTDTRKISQGSLFFALKGDKFDANTFAQQAIEAGAAYVVIDNPQYQLGEKYLLVDDVLTTLQELARHHRCQLQIPVVGLTGTNGKTTTKELINAVLSQKFYTLATQGNLNNHIGVPLTILSITSQHQLAVIEMGANHQREIALLSSIAQPSHGMITNVGKAHLEGFGGVEGVKIGKGELYNYLAASGNVAFVNSNNATLMEMQAARKFKPGKVIFYGDDMDDLVGGSLVANEPYLELTWEDRRSGKTYQVASQLTGSYNLDNILAAICIGLHFDLTPAQINEGISGYQPNNNRSQVTKTATNTLICDYYNANPSSMAVAIENLDKLAANKKVLILGDMFELGDESAAEHKAIIERAMLATADARIFVGEAFYKEKIDGNATFYRTADEAINAIQSNPIQQATVLIKGSRGMALERLVAFL